MAVAFGGLSAHRLFTFPGVIADPVQVSADLTLESTRISFHGRSCHVRARTHTCWASRRDRNNEQLAGGLLESAAACGVDMLFTIAFALLAAWALGLFGMYPGGDLFHVLLLVGLMLLLLAFLRAREAAIRRAVGGDPQ